MIETASPNLDGSWQMMGENIESEMRPLPNAYGGTYQCQPCQRHFADLFDPRERDGVEVEIVGECCDEIAENDADQKIDDGQHDQRGDGDFWDSGEEPQHATAVLERNEGPGSSELKGVE